MCVSRANSRTCRCDVSDVMMWRDVSDVNDAVICDA